MINLDYEPQPYGFSVLPENIYTVEITDISHTKTKKGINMTYTVMEGDYKGRKLFDNANIFHENEVSKAIGYKKLDGISYALGLKQKLTNTAYLLRKPFKIRVTKGVNKEGDIVNRIRRYYKLDETPSAPKTAEISLFTGRPQDLGLDANAPEPTPDEDLPF